MTNHFLFHHVQRALIDESAKQPGGSPTYCLLSAMYHEIHGEWLKHGSLNAAWFRALEQRTTSRALALSLSAKTKTESLRADAMCRLALVLRGVLNTYSNPSNN